MDTGIFAKVAIEAVEAASKITRSPRAWRARLPLDVRPWPWRRGGARTWVNGAKQWARAGA